MRMLEIGESLTYLPCHHKFVYVFVINMSFSTLIFVELWMLDAMAFNYGRVEGGDMAEQEDEYSVIPSQLLKDAKMTSRTSVLT